MARLARTHGSPAACPRRVATLCILAASVSDAVAPCILGTSFACVESACLASCATATCVSAVAAPNPASILFRDDAAWRALGSVELAVACRERLQHRSAPWTPRSFQVRAVNLLACTHGQVSRRDAHATRQSLQFTEFDLATIKPYMPCSCVMVCHAGTCAPAFKRPRRALGLLPRFSHS